MERPHTALQARLLESTQSLLREPTPTMAGTHEKLVHDGVPSTVPEAVTQREHRVTDRKVGVGDEPRKAQSTVGQERFDGPAGLRLDERVAISA